MRIYEYIDDGYPKDLPIAEIWLEEDYPNGILTNTPGLTLHEYETQWDKEHGLPARHDPREERNFVPYKTKIKDIWGREEEYKRITFDKLYRVYYHEVDTVEIFLMNNPDTEVLYHRNHFFVRTWME
jgi:hypothetical protein